MIVSGVMLLEWSWKWCVVFLGFVVFVFFYCLLFSWGFVNFEFGFGFVFWGIVIYFMVVEGLWLLCFVVNLIFVVVFYLVYFFVFGIYGVILGFFELVCSK